MQSITPLNLNLQFPNYSTTMYAVQHDRLSRKITAVLADGAAPFAPEYGSLAVVRYKKPDGTCGFYDTDEDGNDAVTWEDNVATIMLAEQALTVAGTVLCQVQFYNGDEQRLSSFTWKIIVEANVCPDDDITSSDYFNILTQQIASIMEVVTDLPAPSTVLPEMDGTAAIGVRGEFARADHVHPTDTFLLGAINNKGRMYTTEPLTTFFNNVAADEFEVFSAASDMTSKLTSNNYSGLSYGFAVFHPNNNIVEVLIMATGSGKIYTCRIASNGTLSYVRYVALTDVTA